jgi:hypothetical protein
MTTALDSRLVPTAQRLLDKYGATATYGDPSTKSYDPVTSAVTESGATNPTIKITPPTHYSRHLIDGTMIQASDMQTFVAAQDLTFVPKRGYTLTLGSLVWRIERVGPIYTGDEIALYELQLRA